MRFYGSLQSETSLTDMYDVPKTTFINWIESTQPEVTNGCGKKPDNNKVVFLEVVAEATEVN